MMSAWLDRMNMGASGGKALGLETGHTGSWRSVGTMVGSCIPAPLWLGKYTERLAEPFARALWSVEESCLVQSGKRPGSGEAIPARTGWVVVRLGLPPWDVLEGPTYSTAPVGSEASVTTTQELGGHLWRDGWRADPWNPGLLRGQHQG